MSTLLDLVEEVFESDDMSRVASSVESGGVSLSTLNKLYADWGAWATQVELPANPGRSTPYALAAWGGHGTDGLAAAWPKLIGSERRRQLLQRILFKHLIFCDAVALPDPFVASEAPGSRPVPRVDGLVVDEAAVRNWVARVLRNLDHYSALIHSGVIVVVPRPDWIETTEIVELDRAMSDEERRAFPNQPATYLGISHAAQAAASLLTQLRTTKRYPALDPYFPTDGYWSVFRRMHAMSEGVVAGTSSQAALLTEFLRLEVAQPVDLGMHDIVTIRQDGQFDQWRSSIANGITRYLTLAQAAGGAGMLAEPAAELRREVAASVRDAAAAAQQDLGWLERPATTTTIELTLIAGSAATAFVAPPVAAGLAGAAAIPSIAKAFRRWRQGGGALARHVAVFR